MNFRVVNLVRGRWVPHKKHDIVACAKRISSLNGEPPTFDLYRRPSSTILDLVEGLDMKGF